MSAQSKHKSHLVRELRLLLPLFITLAAQAADRRIAFAKDIQPVFEANCWQCHGAAVQLSKLDLTSRDAVLKGGERGAAILPGYSAKSRLYRMISGLEKPAMPAGGKLKPEEIEAIRLWI